MVVVPSHMLHMLQHTFKEFKSTSYYLKTWCNMCDMSIFSKEIKSFWCNKTVTWWKQRIVTWLNNKERKVGHDNYMLIMFAVILRSCFVIATVVKSYSCSSISDVTLDECYRMSFQLACFFKMSFASMFFCLSFLKCPS